MMAPYISDPDFTLYVGDVTDVLATLPDESVHCVVTSPPYWGLRDYGTGSWDGGNPDCDHAAAKIKTRYDYSLTSSPIQDGKRTGTDGGQYRNDCPCGASRVDQQLGLEPTPEAYVDRMVQVFRQVRRVLRSDGTLWLNIGDSYANPPASGTAGQWNGSSPLGANRNAEATAAGSRKTGGTIAGGLKQKDLCGIPWRLAFALQQPYYTGTIKDERDRIWLAAMVEAEGCMFLHKRKTGQSNGQGYVRKNDSYGAGLEVASTDRVIVERCMAIAGIGSICEQGPNENARRKQTIYRWNVRSNECRDIIRELYPHFIAKQHEARLLLGCPSSGDKAEAAWAGLKEIHQGGTPAADFAPPETMFEPGWYVRSDIVWSKANPMPESVTDRPTKAHEYLFLLTKSARYFYDQDAIREPQDTLGERHNGKSGYREGHPSKGGITERSLNPSGRNKRSVWEVATEPYPDAHFATYPQALIEPCIKAGCPEGGVVLDPFLGSGTTALVARRHGRHTIGIELNPEYAQLAAKRLNQLSLLAEGAA